MANGKCKTDATTNLVNQITYTGGRSFSYIYDDEERINRVVDSNGNTTEYTYDCNGIRTSKTVNGVTHTYELDGSLIVKETWGNNQLVPMYDITGSVLGILYNSIPYYFMRNLQNDVIGVANIAAKGITVVINKGITAHAQKGLNHFMFDDMILSDLVGSGLQNNGYNPIYNKLLDQVAKYIMRANGQWARSFMYLFANAGISSLLSGWY